MLARELKSRFDKEKNMFIYFIVAQTVRGNSYTCQIKNDDDINKFNDFCDDLLPLALADNQFPSVPFLNDSKIVSIKFSDKMDTETRELLNLVEFAINYHVDDKDVKGKTVPNTITIKLLKRDYNELPRSMAMTLNNFQKFLSSIAEKACKSEYHQGNIFENNEKYTVEISSSSNAFAELDRANTEILGSQALPQENLEGLQAAVAERVKERNAEKIDVPVEIREEEH